MSTLQLDEARAVITTSLSDADLQEVIDREEAWLARRIGPLDGSRTETFITTDGDEVLQLQRPTTFASLIVTDESGAVSDMALRGWSDLVPGDHAWDTSVEVEYTPDDEPEVKRAAVTLVRLAVTESGYQAESAQGRSATVDHTMRRKMRWEAWRGLLRPAQPQSMPIRSAIPAGGDTVRGVQVTATGS